MIACPSFADATVTHTNPKFQPDALQPTTFAPNQVIKGWTEAMQLMKEGGKWELYIPSELAYGDRGAGKCYKSRVLFIVATR